MTGGTGSFGKKFVEILLRDYHPNKLIIFSRDELKQHEMRRLMASTTSMRYFIGDVRDADRLRRAIARGGHRGARRRAEAGARLRIQPLRGHPDQYHGAENVIDAAIDRGVTRVLALSTDKAVNPVNLYGATKLCAEKLFVQGNAYAGAARTRILVRALRQRGGQPGQCYPAVRGAARAGDDDRHRPAHDPVLDHARPGRALRASTASSACRAARCSCPRSPA